MSRNHLAVFGFMFACFLAVAILAMPTDAQITAPTARLTSFELAATNATSSGLTTMGASGAQELVLTYMGESLNLEVCNGGNAEALTDFGIQIQDHPSGTWYTWIDDAIIETYASNSQDWGMHATLYYVSDGAPSEVAAGACGHIWVNIGSAYAMRFQAEADTNGVAVTVRGTFLSD